MKNYKKITALILMMIFTATTLTACGDYKEKVEVVAETSESTEITEDETVAETEATVVEEISDADELGTDSEKRDLFDYYDVNIEQVATDLTDLQIDDSYKTADGTTVISGPTDTMETLSDGYALAGPFFTVDNDGTVVGINYGGKEYTLCSIAAGIPMSEAADIAKSHGFTFSSVEIAHGTAQYVAIYENSYMTLCITSDAEGEFGQSEESDVTGNVDSVLLYRK